MFFNRFLFSAILAGTLVSCATAPKKATEANLASPPFTGEIPFNPVIGNPEGQFAVELVKDGVLVGGEAPAFGDYAITMEPLDATSFQLNFTFTQAPGDSNEFEYWAALGFMDNPVFMTGDPMDVSGTGIACLVFQHRTEGSSDTYIQFLKTPGLEVLGYLKLPGPIKGRKFAFQMNKTVKGWEFGVGTKKLIITFDKIPEEIFPNEQMYFFAGTHTSKGVPVKITINEMNGVSFRN